MGEIEISIAPSEGHALVVGSAGQDGQLLSTLLIRQGWKVSGVTRRDIDIGDQAAVADLVASLRPDEIYFLAAHHSAAERRPPDDCGLLHESMRVNFTAVVNFLEAASRSSQRTRLFYAATSHIFDAAEPGPYSERSRMNPNTAYAITKYAGMKACMRYREQRGVHASVGILFNHESSLRGRHYVSRKIAEAAVRIAAGSMQQLELGSLDTVVDWGDARDFVAAMVDILRDTTADDFVVATGIGRTVREFAETAFRSVGLDYRDHVVENDALIGEKSSPRIGDSSKLRVATGWVPKVAFSQMVADMVAAERRRLEVER